ncbi:hypothetical protein TNCV_4886981 [Trichonephila clavipes]|uniref:Uncharacterized protein n=1 Tax=Trichonephila clavipes TaxID=2585209 RepID=A0A8X6RVF5_TRICX|nr:hypothetical protein TNCV_4886981 [Trichonephila clavipes]
MSFFKNESLVSGTVVTRVGAPVAWRPRTIDTAVATPLVLDRHYNSPIVTLRFSHPENLSTPAGVEPATLGSTSKPPEPTYTQMKCK